MISKIKKVTFEEQKVLKRTTAGERVFDFINSCGDDGAMLMEIYDGLPDVGERHIRQCVREFVSKNFLDTKFTCRCGRGTIYVAKSAMRLKPYKRRETIIHKVHQKSMHTKQYKDGKTLGKDGKRVKV